MKFKQLALAAALSVAIAPAFAKISFTDDTSEIFALVFNDDLGSYSLDLGITLGDFKAGAITAGYSFAANIGTAYPSAFAGQTVSWGLIAVDADGFSGSEFSMLIGGSNGFTPPANFVNWEQAAATMGGFALTLSSKDSGPTGHFQAVNGDEFSAKGEVSQYTDNVFIGSLGYPIGNAVGTSTPLFLLSSADNTTLDIQKFQGLASFDGQTFRYASTVVPPPPIPEPGTYALMLAGLVGLSAVVRRRIRRD